MRKSPLLHVRVVGALPNLFNFPVVKNSVSLVSNCQLTSAFDPLSVWSKVKN